MAADGDFAAAAELLYGAPATTFIAERNARAKVARSAGDRDLAARISALPKPSAAAILVNRFVRDDGDALDRVLELGAALRTAQEAADRDALRTLGAQRRDLLNELTRAVGERADHPPGAAVLEEFQQTIQAALVSDDAAEAVRTGRLVRALRADGLDPVDLANAVGGSGGPGRATPRKRRSTDIEPDHDSAEPDGAAEPDAPDPEDAAERAERRKEAERLAADADRRADEAERQADQAATAARDATTLVEERQRAAADLEARIEQLRDDLQSAEADLDDARDASAAARAAAESAAAAAERADGEAQTARAAARDAAEVLSGLHE